MLTRRCFGAAATVFTEHKKVMVGSKKLLSHFKEWRFKEPPVYAELPVDDYPQYNEPRAVKDAVFSKVPTEPLTGKLHLVCASDECLSDILDLDPAVADTEEFIDFVAGKYLPDGGLSVSHRYGGYQFGFWADQLGDGRAHILGEYVNSKGESWQPQLKGSGETPYSRFGDGRAVLRSSLRELVASEACSRLRVPTTRAAALVVSDDHKVWRDKSYSGHARQERAAVVMRLAEAWYRIGSLEKRAGTAEEISGSYHTGVGFTHGVLNTDNVSLLGLTIDYGPYGFMDHYSQHYVPNTSDDMGRYAFNKQPSIMLWNLQKFAEALELLLTEDQKQKISDFRSSLEEYVKKKVLQTYLFKLGLEECQDGDEALVDDWLEMMQLTMADFTCSFRQLAEVNPKDLLNSSLLEDKWSLKKICEARQWSEWVRKYQDRIQKENVSEADRRKRMDAVNPAYVPRNWMLQEAIVDAENNDFEKVRFLLKIFKNPFEVNSEAEARGYSAQPPSWAYGLKLSCSS